MLPVDMNYLCFNSKLVRLKDYTPHATAGQIPFQFQTGAIKSMMKLKVCTLLLLSFNSKLVRLKVSRRVPRSDCADRVSIPNWCD